MTEFILELDPFAFILFTSFVSIVLIFLIFLPSHIEMKHGKAIKERFINFKNKFKNTPKDIDAIDYIFNSKDNEE